MCLGRADPHDRRMEGSIRGQRHLSRTEELAWYLFAGLTYIVAALYQKALLTWLVGPAWVVAVLWAGPVLVDRLTGRAR